MVAPPHGERGLRRQHQPCLTGKLASPHTGGVDEIEASFRASWTLNLATDERLRGKPSYPDADV